MKFFKKKPKVTIIITCYNSEKYLKFSINSILRQKFKYWELIVVNDCSTDASLKILNTYKSKKIKIINLKKNVGPYKATELALRKSKGKYIAFLDSDDISHKDRIFSQFLELEKNKNINLVVTQYKIIDQNNKIIGYSKTLSQSEFDRKLPCENLCCNSSAMFRKKVLKKIKFFNKKYFYSCDYNFYLKIFSLSSIKIINKYYIYYRIHPNSRTNTLKKIDIIKEELNHLNFSKKKNLINKSNFFLYYKNLFRCYLKLFLLKFTKVK